MPVPCQTTLRRLLAGRMRYPDRLAPRGVAAQHRRRSLRDGDEARAVAVERDRLALTLAPERRRRQARRAAQRRRQALAPAPNPHRDAVIAAQDDRRARRRSRRRAVTSDRLIAGPARSVVSEPAASRGGGAVGARGTQHLGHDHQVAAQRVDEQRLGVVGAVGIAQAAADRPERWRYRRRAARRPGRRRSAARWEPLSPMSPT